MTGAPNRQLLSHSWQRARANLRRALAACAEIVLRPAALADAPLLRHWDEQPHVIAADPNDDWAWETELARSFDWREQLIAELDGRPIGFVQIIDPALEESRYWGEMPTGLRAIDIWIGEANDLGHGYGTTTLRLALDRCFADRSVAAVLIDPLASNTRAHRFYERSGFRRVGPRRFGDDDCLVFRMDRADWMESTVDRECVHARVIRAARERVFDAFADPDWLARWWGPKGFTNTFEDFDFRAQGVWRSVMHGPDGTDYPNENAFLEVRAPERIVIEHFSGHHFLLFVTLTELAEGTRVEWRQVFDTTAHRQQVAAIVSEANEQNLDRLAAEVFSGEAPSPSGLSSR